MSMQIRFLGPLGKVTGSCAWMRDESRDWNFLVDCGMQQGELNQERWNAGDEWPFAPNDLKFVILTHAHVDHCGMLPELYRQGFEGSVYCTRETADLAKILLLDAAKLPEIQFDAKHVNLIKFHTPKLETHFGGHHPVAEDLFIRFFRSGHILGAASVTVLWGPPETKQGSIIFSGDIGPGRKGQEVLPILRPLMYPKPSDFAVIESTYGNKIRSDAEREPAMRRARLAAAMIRSMDSGGTLAIPAFSLGRTQDLLFDIHYVVASDPDRYHGMKFLLDSPMANTINDITCHALGDVKPQGRNGKVRPMWLGNQVLRDLGLDKANPDHFEHALDACKLALTPGSGQQVTTDTRGNTIFKQWRSLFRLATSDDRENAETHTGPRLIVMSSGMCDGGAATKWLPSLLRSARNEVMLTGYCAPGTVGSSLQELAGIPNQERRRLRDDVVWHAANEALPRRYIMAQVSTLPGYSAHADQVDLVGWAIHEQPHDRRKHQSIAGRLFLQHGSDHARKALAAAIDAKASEHGLDIDIARPGDASSWITLETEK